MSLFTRTSAPIIESSQELEAQKKPIMDEKLRIEEIFNSAKKELAKYDTDGYREFRNSVLLDEKSRLAQLLIEQTGEDADGRDARLSIRGQYAEVVRLIDRPSELKTEIENCDKLLFDISAQISEVDTKIKSARAREE